MPRKLEHPDYKTLRYWGKQYARSEQPDQKGALEFALVEPDQLLKSFKSDLHAVSKGRYDDRVLDNIVGVKRKVRYGGYQEWARLMLLWLASYKR